MKVDNTSSQVEVEQTKPVFSTLRRCSFWVIAALPFFIGAGHALVYRLIPYDGPAISTSPVEQEYIDRRGFKTTVNAESPIVIRGRKWEEIFHHIILGGSLIACFVLGVLGVRYRLAWAFLVSCLYSIGAGYMQYWFREVGQFKGRNPDCWLGAIALWFFVIAGSVIRKLIVGKPVLKESKPNPKVSVGCVE